MSTTSSDPISNLSESGSTPLPLSARQTLLWLDDQLYPDARYHNLVQLIEVTGPLDVGRLSSAFAETVASRDSLRLSVDARDAKQVCLDLPVPDLPVLSLDPSELQHFILERSSRRINNGAWLWDAALLRLGDEHHLFYFCQDHIVSDGLSFALLVRELEQRYQNQSIPPAASFREYLKNESEYRQSTKWKRDKEYWDDKVAKGAPPLRPYGISRTDPSAALHRVWCDVDPLTVKRLLERASAEPFCSKSPGFARLLVMATALSALLYRVTGNREVLIGSPLANRRGPFKQTLGLLMEQLFFRVSIADGDTLATLAGRVRDEVHTSLEHSPCCVSDRGIEYVTLNMVPSQPTQFAGMPARLQFSPVPTLGDARSGVGDLRDTLGLQVMDYADGALQLAFDFHAATFDDFAETQLRSHFVRILGAIAENLDQPLDTIVLTDEAERSALHSAAQGRIPTDAAPDVVARFEEIAQRNSTQVAVCGPDATLSYAELDASTNRLARRLLSLGVGRESRVGVAVPRGAGELVALMATLKAGGAYVPVDPNHPVERVRVILADASPQVLIAPSDSPLRAALPAGTTFLPFDKLDDVVAGFDASPVGVNAAQPNQLAYILFTSGSTGRPKGVEVPRGAFANFLRSMAEIPGLRASDRLLAITTTTFDIAGLELFLPLCVGATVVIADRDTATDPRRLRDRLALGDISVMQATPATWRLLIDAGFKGDQGLRMFVGGEALSPELAQELLLRGSELWNLYGPTETTIWSSVEQIRSDDSRITIGRPIDCTQIYVLDPALQPVPRGVIGEIYIGGQGLARGYYGRPDLTVERFVPDPFAGPLDRIYRTGDLGRVLSDGRLECLGRADSQVKIRGFRIELGEIESVLRSVAGVQEVVVTVAAQKGNTEQRLVAYWIGEAERSSLLAQARDRLPQYMVPSAYLRLEHFPLTTSGKIDRKALPPVDTVELTSTGIELPRTEFEVRIAKLFSEILGVSPVGVGQDFFELGGTSVLVIQARERFEREFGVELPLRTFFRSPTVAALAAHLAQSSTTQSRVSRLIQLKPGRDEPALFLVHDADGEVVLYRNLAMRMPAGVAVYGIAPRGAGRLPVVHRSIEAMSEYYLREIRDQQPNGPYFLGGLCAGGVIAFEIARRLVLAGEQVALLALIDSIAPSAPLRPDGISEQRLQRSIALLRGLPTMGIPNFLAEAGRRLRSVTAFEVERIKKSLLAKALLFVHTRIEGDDDNAAWPDWLPVPSTRDIYMNAASSYQPQPVAGIPAVLVRATDLTDGDRPGLSMCATPDFGWSPLLGSSLRIVDASGGHSTLLQETSVDGVARHLLSAFA